MLACAAGGCWLTANYDELVNSYRAEVIADHPVVYLRFEESSGPTAHDEMGNDPGGYPAAAIDFGVAGGLAGDSSRAIDLNVDALPDDLQGVAMPAGLDFAGNAAFTVEVWARPTVFHGAGSLVDHSDYAAATEGWTLRWDETGVEFERYANGTTRNGGAWSPALPVGAYRHLVGVFDGTQIRLYVDGALQRAAASSFPLAATGSWTIGKQNCNFPCTQNGFAGSIDELAIYDDDLSESRIESHHRVGRGE